MKKKGIYTIVICSAIFAPAWSQTTQNDTLQKGSNGVQQNTILIDSLKKEDNIKNITQKVVESTFKNYPQQPGQPTIIINNIILPPDFNKQPPAPAATAQPMGITQPDPKTDPDYQMWLRDKYQREAAGTNPNYSGDNSQQNYSDQGRDRLTFQQRFGERPMRNSGTWVIPMVGVHASNFNANFDDGEFKGRTGWNAGLDVRIRARRFFVQPGVHYFNSSLQVTDKDSLSDAKLLDGPRIHSLKVPVMLGIYLTKANKGFFKFNIKAGAVGNYLIAVDKSNIRQFDKANLHDFSYGVNGGIGLEFGLITLDITHEWGITKFFKNSDQKNNILRGTLGIKI